MVLTFMYLYLLTCSRNPQIYKSSQKFPPRDLNSFT